MARTTTATLWLAVGLLSLARPARAQTPLPLLEVEKSDATKLLQVTDDAGFLVRGEYGTGTIPASGAGTRLMWYPGKGAFRAGIVSGSQWDDAGIGLGSVALGRNTTASGTSSVALNDFTLATGSYSLAGGHGTSASGGASLAVGEFAMASGPWAVALGNLTKAAGQASMATGDRTVANGDASVALGSSVTAQGDGSFVFGDQSTQFPITAARNSFNVRAFGGIRLNTGINIGCDLHAGSGTWACTSSRLAKEGFEDVDGEAVLTKLAAMPIQRWRYLGSAAAHIGPFAEDFHAAFGLGESSTKIATVDADGIALRAIQALERRTAALQAETAALRAETAELRTENAELRVEAAELRRRLETLESARHQKAGPRVSGAR